MNNTINNLYQHSANESSPVKLDNLIINQAKLNCEVRNTKQKSRRWLYSLATAAVFVMGFSMILNLQNMNQQMQVAPPQTIKSEKNIGFESKPEADITTGQQSNRTLKKKFTPAKQKSPNPKSITQETGNISLRESTTSTTPSPHSTSIVTPEPLTKLINEDSTSAASKETINSMAGSIKDEEATNMKNSFKKKHINGQINYDEGEELNPTIVTDSRIRNDILIDETKPDEIIELEKFIREKRFIKAKKLLKILKVKFPNMDFTEQEKLINTQN